MDPPAPIDPCPVDRRIPVTLLTVIKRQDKGSAIVDAAHAIRHSHLRGAPKSVLTGRAKLPRDRQGAHQKTTGEFNVVLPQVLAGQIALLYADQVPELLRSWVSNTSGPCVFRRAPGATLVVSQPAGATLPLLRVCWRSEVWIPRICRRQHRSHLNANVQASWPPAFRFS